MTVSIFQGPGHEQARCRRSISVGPTMRDVSPMTYWIGHGLDTPEAVLGAMKLAYEQAQDGMGTSTSQWTGLSDEQLGRFRQGGEYALALAEELLAEAARRNQRLLG